MRREGSGDGGGGGGGDDGDCDDDFGYNNCDASTCHTAASVIVCTPVKSTSLSRLQHRLRVTRLTSHHVTYLSHHASHHASCVTRHASYVMRLTSHLVASVTSHIRSHVSCVPSRVTSRVMRQVTRHLLHLDSSSTAVLLTHSTQPARHRLCCMGGQ